MCRYVHVCAYICVHVCLSVYMCVYVWMCPHVYTYKSMFIQAYLFMSMSMHAYGTCMSTSPCVCVPGFLETRLHICKIISIWHVLHWPAAKISFKKDFFPLGSKYLKTTASDCICDSIFARKINWLLRIV